MLGVFARFENLEPGRFCVELVNVGASGAGCLRDVRFSLVTVESPHPLVDTRRFPIVVVSFTPSATAHEMRALTIALRRFATGLDEPIGVLSDLSAVRTPDPEARLIYAEFVREVRNVSGKWVRGIAVVTQNPFQRALSNLHATLVGKTPYPVQAFATVRQALPWLLAKVETRAETGARLTF